MKSTLLTRKYIYVLGIAILFLGTTGRFVGFLEYGDRIVSYVLYPIMKLQNICIGSLRFLAEKRRTHQEMTREITQLQQEKEELLSNVIRLHALLGFAADTKELIVFRQRYDNAHAILAQVLVKHISEQAQFFILDAGETKGVRKNMVVVYKDHLLGKIVEVYPFYSKAVLITDRSCKVSAYCAQTKANGIYGGNNHERNTMLMHVSHLAPMLKGDKVISSGDGLVFPRGFSLGAIADFSRNDLYYDITVELLVDIRKIAYCYILQKGNEPIAYALDSVPTITRTTEELLYARTRKPRFVAHDATHDLSALEESSSVQIDILHKGHTAIAIDQTDMQRSLSDNTSHELEKNNE